MGATEALVVQGISLPEYAAVKAALGEGFPDAEVLKVEGIEPRRFSRADPAWKVRLVDDPPVFAAYGDELAAAEDWLDREISPIGDDAAAWAAFLSAFAAGGAELLSAHGLRLSDVARLRRRWARRIEQDPKLEERITEHRKRPAPLPVIRVAPPVLRPSRYSRDRAGAAATAALPDAAPPELTLDRYAALCAEIAERPADSAGALARYGLSGESALYELDRAWRAEMERDPLVAADFRRLFAHNRARLSAPGKGPSAVEPSRDAGSAPAPAVFHAAPPAIRAALRGTSLALDIPRGPALPFGPATPGAPPKAAAAPPPSAPRPGDSLTGTVLALDVPAGNALPFVTEAAPATPKLAGTSLAVDVPRGPALPFEAPPRAAPAEAPKERSLPAPAPSGSGTGTSLALDVPRGEALPFAAPSPGKSKLGKLALSLDVQGALRTAKLSQAAEPARPPPLPDPGPALTVEQYASLCVEIWMSPSDAARTVARYRLTMEEKAALDAHYGERMAREPAVRQAWEQACLTYRAWLLEARGGRP